MDEATLERWYADYGYAVERRCARILQTEAEARDAVRDVFRLAYRLGDAPPGQTPLGYLYRLTNRLCVDRLRHRGTRALRAAREAGGADERQLFGQALAASSAKVREVALLYFVDAFTRDEVAQRLKLSRRAVDARLARFEAAALRLARRYGPGTHAPAGDARSTG